MRILAVTQSYPLHPEDSTAPFVGAIVAALAERGHSLDVVLPEHPEFRQRGTEGVRFFPYRYSPVPGWAPWGFGNSLTGGSRITAGAVVALPGVLVSLRRRLSALLSGTRYDAVHAHWLVPNAWIAAGAAGRRAVPLVVSLHGSDVAVAERVGALRPIWRRTLGSAGAVTAPSDDLRIRAVRLGADPSTASTVHYGVDTDVFAPHGVDPRRRAELGAPAEGVLVVTVGRLVEKKGFRYLIEAAARVGGVHLAIVGDGGLRDELRALARDAGGAVTFTGELDHVAVANAIAAADVVAVPSVVDSAGNVDGLPNTLLEALSTGRPVVASAVAGIPEVITDGKNGLLVPQRDVDALAGALARMRDDVELRHRLGHAARERAVRELGWEVTAEAIERAFVTAGAAL